jgi:hypothetical protein
MKLEISRSDEQKLVSALNRAGKRETGGILMGEHVEPGLFRVSELTVQMQMGSFASFVRLVDSVVVPPRRFFARTGHDYRRFNYLGEWHSHHSFALIPSSRDRESMQEIVLDTRVGARFAVLMLVRLGEKSALELDATVFQPYADPIRVEIVRMQ